MFRGCGSENRRRNVLLLAAACLIGANIGAARLAKSDEVDANLRTGTAASTKPAARAVFAGNDTRGRRGLWVTDGTAAGTSQLMVADAYSGGLLVFTGFWRPRWIHAPWRQAAVRGRQQNWGWPSCPCRSLGHQRNRGGHDQIESCRGQFRRVVFGRHQPALHRAGQESDLRWREHESILAFG